MEHQDEPRSEWNATETESECMEPAWFTRMMLALAGAAVLIAALV